MSLKKSISLSIKLEHLKGSVNRMMIIHKHDKKRMLYSGNYREAKKKVENYLKEKYNNLENSMVDHPEFYYLDIKYIAYDNWLTKSSGYKKLRKKDVANFQKNAEDVVCSFLGVDDSFIRYSSIEKGLIECTASTAQLDIVVELYEMDKKAFKSI